MYKFAQKPFNNGFADGLHNLRYNNPFTFANSHSQHAYLAGFTAGKLRAAEEAIEEAPATANDNLFFPTSQDFLSAWG